MILPGFPDLVSEVETIGAPAHRPFHVLSNVGSRSRWARPGPQYLKRSMKCCGDTGVKQLSGSAAVQGWPESCGRGRALPHVPGGKTAQKSPGIHLNAPGPHRTGMRTARIRDTWLLSGESPRASAWGTGRPSLGAGRSPRFPAPQPRPRPGHAAPSAHGGPGSTLELCRAPPTHVPLRAQHHVPRQKHPGLACVRTASGPGGQLGQCLETGLPPSQAYTLPLV